jgi:uncharacterized protein
MLSEEKISHLSHVLLKGLLERGAITLRGDEGALRREIKHSIHSFLKINEDIDSVVRKKLQSFSRRIIEGSPEWEVLYRKYHREETIKRGLATE